jgi:hypothetical protein
MNALLEEHRTPWLVMWQGDYDPSYRVETRRRLEEIVERRRLPYFDPSPDFARDHARSGNEYRIPGDGHWNADGHRVVAEALARVVIPHLAPPRVTPTPPPTG